MSDDVKVTGSWVDKISAESSKTFHELRNEFSLTQVAMNALGFVGALSLERGFDALKEAIHETTEAAIAQERAQVGLANALEASGKFSQAFYNRLLDQASALEETTRFSEEAVEAAQAYAVNLGVGVGKIEEYTRAAAALAVMTGKDLPAAMQVLTRADLGSEMALRRLLGPTVDLSHAVEILGAKYDLVVEQSMGPLERAQHDLDVQIDESKKRLGQYAATWDNVGRAIQAAILKMQTAAVEAGTSRVVWDEKGNYRDVSPREMQATKQMLIDSSIPGLESPWMQAMMGRAPKSFTPPDFIGPPTGFSPGPAAGSSTGELTAAQRAFEALRKDFREVMGYALSQAYRGEGDVPAGVMSGYLARKGSGGSAWEQRLGTNSEAGILGDLPERIVDLGLASQGALHALDDELAEQARAEEKKRARLEVASGYASDWANGMVSIVEDMSFRSQFTLKNWAEGMIRIVESLFSRAIGNAVGNGAYSFAMGVAGGGTGGGDGSTTGPGTVLGRDPNQESARAAYDFRRGRRGY